jgi:hypothetical protein
MITPARPQDRVSRRRASWTQPRWRNSSRVRSGISGTATSTGSCPAPSTAGARPVDFSVRCPLSASRPGSATARVSLSRGFARFLEPQESCEPPLTVKGVPGLTRSIFDPPGSRRVHWSALPNQPLILIGPRVHSVQQRAGSIGDRGHEGVGNSKLTKNIVNSLMLSKRFLPDQWLI